MFIFLRKVSVITGTILTNVTTVLQLFEKKFCIEFHENSANNLVTFISFKNENRNGPIITVFFFLKND